MCLMINQLFGLLCALVVITVAEPVDYHLQNLEVKKPPIPIIKHTFDQHKGGYQFSYETGNGIHHEESGYIKNKGDKKHETLVQQGTVTYHDEHGHPITLTYIADEHGFQPQGAHLPTPPPIPAEIQKALQENAHHHQQYEEPQHYEPPQNGGHEEYGQQEPQGY